MVGGGWVVVVVLSGGWWVVVVNVLGWHWSVVGGGVTDCSHLLLTFLRLTHSLTPSAQVTRRVRSPRQPLCFMDTVRKISHENAHETTHE